MLSAVSADGEQHIQVHPLDGVADGFHIGPAPGGAKNSPPLGMNVVDNIRIQGHHRNSVLGQKTAISVAYSRYPMNPVAVPEGAHQGPDHVIQTWAETAAGHDTGMNVAGRKKDLLPGTGLFQEVLRGILNGITPRPGIDVIKDKLVIPDVVCHIVPGFCRHLDGRSDLGLSKSGNGKIKGVHTSLLIQHGSVYCRKQRNKYQAYRAPLKTWYFYHSQGGKIL